MKLTRAYVKEYKTRACQHKKDLQKLTYVSVKEYIKLSCMCGCKKENI